MKLLRLMNEQHVKFLTTEFHMDELQFATMSESVKSILGYTPSEMIGQGIEQFVVKADLLRSSMEVEHNREQGVEVPDLFANVYKRKDGEKVLVLWANSDTDKEFALCLGVPISEDVLLDLVYYFLRSFPSATFRGMLRDILGSE